MLPLSQQESGGGRWLSVDNAASSPQNHSGRRLRTYLNNGSKARALSDRDDYQADNNRHAGDARRQGPDSYRIHRYDRLSQMGAGGGYKALGAVRA